MKKLISFGLWYDKKWNKHLRAGKGDEKYYLYGAVMNAHLAKVYYPDWTLRYYCANSVPNKIKSILRELGAEIVEMDTAGDWTSMFWRFYPASEPDIDVMISRDVDSRLNKREAVAVQEWIKSDKLFHTMRDHSAHGVPILGGMWGVKKGCIPNMKELIDSYVKENYWQVDQDFLSIVVTPLVKDKWMEHDPYFARKPFTVPNTPGHFVGLGVDTDYEEIEKLFPELRNIDAITN